MEDAAPAPKRRGGWPKGKPRNPAPAPEQIVAAANRAEQRAALPETEKRRFKMKARPNWENDDYIGVGQEGSDRLKVPDTIIDALHRDGYALQWITKSVRGQETPQEVSKMTRGGWTPVHQSDFDGLMDGLFMPKGHDDVITVDDCMLVARPVEIHMKSKMMERREANRPLQIAEEQLGVGIPGVTGSNHPTATRGNMIKKHMERVEIPE
jgi:hypothetical protein